MSCSVSRPVSCPGVPVSDTGTRGMIQGVIQNNVIIYSSHIYNKKLSHTCNWAHIDKISFMYILV